MRVSAREILVPFLTPLVWRNRGANPRPTTPEADALTTRLSGPVVHMVHRIYPAELQLKKANASDTEAAFLDLNLSVHNDILSTKIYDKRDDFNFDIVNFPFLYGDYPRRPSYGVYTHGKKLGNTSCVSRVNFGLRFF